MATPAPAPSPSPAPPALKPGYLTSEAWISFLVALPGLILNSGLVANAPTLLRLVSMAASLVAALGYTTNRTLLKKAHLAYAAGAPSNDNGARKEAGFIKVNVLVALALIGAIACTTLHTMGGAFAACAQADLNEVVNPPPGSPIAGLPAAALETFVQNIITLNVAALEAQLGAVAAIVGVAAVKCAIAAVEAAVPTIAPSSGSSAMPQLAAVRPPGLDRAEAWAASH